MVAWLFRWHDEHRRTALLPGIAFLGFFGLQLFTEIRFHQPVVPEPVGYLIAASLLLSTLVSLVLALALWLRACLIIHMDRHAMGVERVRMAVERLGRVGWDAPTSSMGNPRIGPPGVYGRIRPTLSTVDDDPTEAFDDVVRNFNKRDIDAEPPTGDVAS